MIYSLIFKTAWHVCTIFEISCKKMVKNCLVKWRPSAPKIYTFLYVNFNLKSTVKITTLNIMSELWSIFIIVRITKSNICFTVVFSLRYAGGWRSQSANNNGHLGGWRCSASGLAGGLFCCERTVRAILYSSWIFLIFIDLDCTIFFINIQTQNIESSVWWKSS